MWVSMIVLMYMIYHLTTMNSKIIRVYISVFYVPDFFFTVLNSSPHYFHKPQVTSGFFFLNGPEGEHSLVKT